MPRLRPCVQCGRPSSSTRCADCHTPRRDPRPNNTRPPHRKAYQDPGYRQARTLLRGEPCWMCGQPSDTIDHITPLAKGGTNDPANLAPACRSCNSRRGATPT